MTASKSSLLINVAGKMIFESFCNLWIFYSFYP
ncbi:hypothetical protein CoNPh17_CDS0153 [Staphylococcus phage S-CoN_Ph17]|nr:hypothetical protein CoNPh17_CDS0153 [Staphylococcus phage S-CoN_Ph17]